MKILQLFAFLCFATRMWAAPLEFDSLLKEVHLSPEADTVTVDFHFQNKAEKEVAIQRSEASCNCMQIAVQGGKLKYQPGEKGIVRVAYDMKLFTGVVDKSVMLYLDDDQADKPSVVLTTRIHIPVLIEIDPKPVKWQVGEEPVEKTITITMKHSKPVRVLRIAAMAEGMHHELRTVEEGKIYQLAIKPKDTKQPGLASFRIETDCAMEKYRVQQAFAVIRR